jgi:ssDNA-binding Zn-finger/Zn-ribbon topoisomerase 1
MSQPMQFDMAQSTVKRYVCARCWRPLIVTYHDGQNFVECSNAANCDGSGFVTAAYAERRRNESHAELIEARRNLESILPARPKRTEEEIMRDLGL